MTNIHLIGGEKGGVGKSVVARLLAQYFIDHSIPFLGFDSDRSHGALLRFYAGYASAVVIDRYESLDAIVEAAAEQPERRRFVGARRGGRRRLCRQGDGPRTRVLRDGEAVFARTSLSAGDAAAAPRGSVRRLRDLPTRGTRGSPAATRSMTILNCHELSCYSE